ncbi:transglycosylase domain-containing protein [Catenulispora yoronensis]|uniref:Transglycosylase domain-containing protein n=1 Tax=Catenulispora yoronensis TaxID=450799 RepID=A0ABN2UVP9_9ACTN
MALGGKRFIDYPRRGKTGVRRWIPSYRLIGAVFLAFIMLLTGGAWAVYASISIPPINESVTQQHLTVVDRNGVVLGRRGPEIRQDVPLSKVPEGVQNAFLSAEDRNYWSESAISLTGTARAVLNDIGGGDTQGGSTITQQYVKNAYLTDERSLSRKIKEAVIAMKISDKQSKGEIFQGYLNTVYFGRGASGVQMAARAWFSKDVDQLSVAEGAVLASLVNAPSYFETAQKDPQAMAKLKGRWAYVLDGMVTMGKLSKSDRDALQFPSLALWPRPSSDQDAQYPYLVEAAIAEAQTKTGLSREQLVTGGYTIKTTFDAKMQDAAAAAVKNQITDQLDPAKRDVDKYVQASVATVVPGDGAVRVLYGGDDYAKQAFNAAWQGTLSPGSSFKTFALAAYLQAGGSVSDTFDGDSPYRVPGGNTLIPNEGGQSYGPVSVQYALNQSINTAFVELGEKIGMTKVADAARAAGVPVDVKNQNVPALPLGVVSTNPEQMAAAYATFAAHGQQVDPYTVTSVEQGGKAVYSHQSLAKQAFTPDIADQVTRALQGVVVDGSGAGAALSDGRDVAGKTGTTDLPGDGTKLGSAWFVGYTPGLSTAVAVWGEKDDGTLTAINGLGGKTVGGGALAAPLWSAYMNKAVAGTPAQSFSFSAQNNQPQPMNPVSPTGSTPTGPSTTQGQPSQNQTGLPSPPKPTDGSTQTYQPTATGGRPTGGPDTSSKSSSGGKTNQPSSTGSGSKSSSGPTTGTVPNPPATTSGSATGGPVHN